METHETIRALRSFKGYSQSYMAHRLGMGQENYSNYECGKYELTVKLLKKIAAVLDMTAAEVLMFEEEKFLHKRLSQDIENRVCRLEEQFALFQERLRKILSGEGGEQNFEK